VERRRLIRGLLRRVRGVIEALTRRVLDLLDELRALERRSGSGKR
jgi:hypothetical protein